MSQNLEDMKAMIAGTYVSEEEPESVTAEVDTVGEEVIESKEDTELVTEAAEDTDTTGVDADLPQDTEEEVVVDDEENTLVEGDDEKKDGTEAPTDVVDAEKTPEIDYRKQYEELLETSKEATAFYDELNNMEFTANGKTRKGTTDVDRLKQAQQKMYGYESKMASVKSMKKFMAPLKDMGMLDDPDKFNMAMDLLKGDKSALKHHMESLSIDPLDIIEMEADTDSYVTKKHISSDAEMVYNDTLDYAKEMGVADQLEKTILKDWDAASIQAFVKDPTIGTDLVKHMNTGAYDVVQEKIADLSMYGDDSFKQLSNIDQYKAAVNVLSKEHAATKEQVSKDTAVKNTIKESDDIKKAATDAAVEKLAEEKYRARLLEEEQADEARRSASTISKPRPASSKPIVKKQSKADFRSEWQKMMQL